jgi:hypothetical protein
LVKKLESIETTQIARFLDSLQIAFSNPPIVLTILLSRPGQCDQKGSKMIWAQLLAYVTGTVDQELLAAENRIPKVRTPSNLPVLVAKP